MLVNAKNKTNTGIQYDLTNSQDLLVGKNITVHSLDDDAIYGEGKNQEVTILGTVIGDDDGVELTGNRAIVTIEKSGTVFSDDDGIVLDGLNVTVNNAGVINSNYWAINLSGDGAGTVNIVNSGSMVANQNVIDSNSDQKIVLRNSGLMSSETELVINASTLVDKIFNTGIMEGNLDLNEGNDLFDGRGGIVFGTVLGDLGNDRFVLGTSADDINGGADIDTLDYRNGGGVKVALDGAFANAGANAKGDTYVGIENIYGSLTGADSLQGDTGNNELRGYGGKDTLLGGAGNDILIGGTGVDTITTGTGTNQIRFGSLSDIGDKLTDFGNAFDDIWINGTAFGGNLTDGLLDSSRFSTGTDNRADDGNDRFIYNTATDTLWFDRDGNKSGFTSVLVADNLGGNNITANDIFIF